MNSPQDYQTTATGSIDYAHYTRIAQDIRQQDARAIFGHIARISRVLAELMRGRHASSAPKPKRLSTTR